MSNVMLTLSECEADRNLMDIFKAMQSFGHEQLLLSHDPSCGYLGIIAIHDTTLGPALGGTRFWQYQNTDEAVTDALRLARGMTYKAAVAGINLGGGKSVIIGDNRRVDREALFRAHGRFVETLERPLHHRGGRGHRPGRHGVHQAGDRPRRRPARPLGRSVAGDGVRHLRGDEGGGEGALGQRLARGEDGLGAGRRQRRLPPLPPPPRGRRPPERDRHPPREGQARGGRVRRRGRRPRRDLRPEGPHLRPLRPRRHDQRRHHPSAQSRDHRRRRPTTSSPRTATATSWRSAASSTPRTT